MRSSIERRFAVGVEALLSSVARLELHRQLDLLLGGQQLVSADLVEPHLDRIGDGDRLVIEEIVEDVVLILLNPDLLGAKEIEHRLELIRRRLHVDQVLLNLVNGQEPALQTALDQLLDDLVDGLRCVSHDAPTSSSPPAKLTIPWQGEKRSVLPKEVPTTAHGGR